MERKNKEKEQKRIEAAIRAEELEVERERINFEREKAAAEQRRQAQSEQFLSESPKPIAHASKPDQAGSDAALLSGCILFCTIAFCCGCPVLLDVGRGPSGSSSSPSYDISPEIDHESNRISDRQRQRLQDSVNSLSDDDAVEVFVQVYNGSSGSKKQELYDGVVSRASSGDSFYKSVLSRISRP